MKNVIYTTYDLPQLRGIVSRVHRTIRYVVKLEKIYRFDEDSTDPDDDDLVIKPTDQREEQPGRWIASAGLGETINISDVSGLTDALAGKLESPIEISDVNGLQDALDAAGGGGGPDATAYHSGDALCEPDFDGAVMGAQDIGSVSKRINAVFSRQFVVYDAAGDSYPSAILVTKNLSLGMGGSNPYDLTITAQGSGISIMGASQVLRCGTVPSDNADLVNKLYVDNAVSGAISDANAFHKTGDAFGGNAILGTTDNYDVTVTTNNTARAVFRKDGKFAYGASDIFTMEADADPRWIYAYASAHFTEFQVQNTSAATSAGTTILAINATGNGVSITAMNDAWDGSTATGYNHGDAGMGYRSSSASIPAEARLVCASGPLPFSVLTGGSGVIERLRVTPSGTVIAGTDYTEIQAGNVLLQVSKNQNASTSAYVSNTTDGAASLVGWCLMGNGSHSAYLGLTAPSYTPSGDFLADQVQIVSNNNAGGIRLITGGTGPISLMTGGSVLINKSTNFDAGHCLFEAEKNQNSYTLVRFGNTTTGTGAVIAAAFEADGSTFGQIGMTSSTYNAIAARGSGCMFIDCGAASGLSIATTSNTPIVFKTNGNNTRMIVYADGGIVIGAPTGASKGAGTLNVENDIYKSNSAYANPDYVFEHWATGTVEQFKDNDGAAEYRGRMPLEDLEAYCKKHFRLPGITDAGMGAFKRSDFLLEKLEEVFLYLFDLKREIGSRMAMAA